MSAHAQPPGPGSGFGRRSFIKVGATGVGLVAFPSLLSACTGETAGDDGVKGIENVEQVQLGTETEGVMYPEGYVGPRASEKKPFHDGSKTFKVVVVQDAQFIGKWEDNEFSKWLEKRTGVKVEYQAILTTSADGSTDLSKINAMMASGDLPDAFLSMPFTRDQISLYGLQGVFVALDDYIETYAPEQRRARREYPDLTKLQSGKDGKTYNFGGVNDCYHCRCGDNRAWVNQKYVDKVGGKIPETTEELRELLKLFKRKDPTGKGKFIPFAASVDGPIDRFIMNAFLYNPGGDRNGGWIRVVDGKMDFVANKDEWRAGLEFLRSLFDDGTLAREVFTMTGEELLRVGNQGRVGFGRAWGRGSIADIQYEDGALWKDYVSVSPLKGPDGVQYTAWNHYGYEGAGLVITSSCSNPEIMVQWADAQMEMEATMAGTGGIKEKNWSWAKEGDKGINDKQAVFRLESWPPPLGQSWIQNSVMYRSNDFRLSQYIDPEKPNFEKGLYEASTKYEPFAPPKEMQLPPLIFDESQAAQKADTAVSVQAHVKQSMAKFAVGELDINDDAAWDAYVNRFEEMGLTAYLDLYQLVYDERPK